MGIIPHSSGYRFYKVFTFGPVRQFETKADSEMQNIREYLILSVCVDTCLVLLKSAYFWRSITEVIAIKKKTTGSKDT
jgi:hypothetical protein